MARHLRLLLAVPLVLAFAPAPKPKDDDAKAVQGTWKIVRAEESGKPVDNKSWLAVTTVVIKGGRLEFHEDFRSGKVVTPRAIVLGPKKKPKEITLSTSPEDAPFYPGTFPGIYKLEKDTLTICYTTDPRGARPKEFKTAPGAGSEHLFVLQRVKP